MTLTIDRDRLLSEIEALGSISEAEPPVVTRIVFSPSDLRARGWMKACCQEAGLTVREDAVGNTFARWNGSEPDAPAVGYRLAHRRHSERREIRWRCGCAGWFGSDTSFAEKRVSSPALD
jgi:hypothetical protein